MTSRGRGVTLQIMRDGVLGSTTLRFPYWIYRTVLVIGVLAAILAVLAVALAGPIARQAARVPGLEREVERLQSDNLRVRALAAALDSVESRYAKLRSMVGADIAPDPVLLTSSLPVAPVIRVLPAPTRPRYETGPGAPRHWPLDDRGYLTRGQIGRDSTEAPHPGVDIAVAVGSVVRATAGGTVLQVGDDREYGRFVLVQHPNGYQSMYGHLSRAVAAQGARIRAGEVLGRSGNTGRSSAPHLHFEIRHNGVSIDPLTMVRENR